MALDLALERKASLHGERVHSNYTRVVVLVWLFVVLALNSSYTANLSSMLTVSRLESSVTNVEWVRRNNTKVGCDTDSFIGYYLVNNLQFKMDNLKKIHSEYDYPSELQSSNITPTFLELPHAKAFLLENCNGYIATELPNRFGGFGFVTPTIDPKHPSKVIPVGMFG
ncbi:hypothetical protein HYC85_003452 [Camellia sinensis]|uniref:Ionotropic glutamate receptor C-terminal domain-containing protein n=1 Tax=Camellia sinensis TaxID=4442 RepID=A0A7J7HV10_CAMSI|nr:hypothetical protein HYC85_003452 [Camellia sinensis]